MVMLGLLLGTLKMTSRICIEEYADCVVQDDVASTSLTALVLYVGQFQIPALIWNWWNAGCHTFCQKFIGECH